MQDNIFASHSIFGRYVMHVKSVNSHKYMYASNKFLCIKT